MIPSSLLGVVLFVVLLAPGLAYVLRHERVVPARSHTAFREALRVIFVSIACLTLTIGFVVLLHAFLPTRMPDLSALINDPGKELANNRAWYVWWTVAAVAFATLVGAVFADRRVVHGLNRFSRTKAARWLTGATDADITSGSAWDQVFNDYKEKDGAKEIYLGAKLDDDTYIEGLLQTFNVAADEDTDREIVLKEPLRFTVNDERVDFQGHYAIISARHIVRLDVTPLAAAPPAVGSPKTASAVRRVWARQG